MLSLSVKERNNLAQTILRLDQWLETMRGPYGYCGPVAHWWDSSLLYCGPMADWRYEGIVSGYLALYQCTGQDVWLDRARRACDDLVGAQLPSGQFRNSSFERGPIEGGTPHEAAADIGLLELAQTLRKLNDMTWLSYFRTAQRNIHSYLLAKLWNGQGFRDQPWNDTLVPNKNATTIEALILYETISGEDMSGFIQPAIEVILTSQEKDGLRAGGTVHLGSGHHRLAIGIYTARSMGGILRAYERQPNDQWLEAVRRAVQFLVGLFSIDGPAFGRYLNGELISNPRLIAGAGDLLRVFAWSHQYGLVSETDVRWLLNWLINNQSPSGGLPTGAGFARRGVSRPYKGLPEFRDLLPVVGWNDKTFRALACIVPSLETKAVDTITHEDDRDCVWKGHACIFHEDSDLISLTRVRDNHTLYHWKKGTCFPMIYHL